MSDPASFNVPFPDSGVTFYVEGIGGKYIKKVWQRRISCPQNSEAGRILMPEIIKVLKYASSLDGMPDYTELMEKAVKNDFIGVVIGRGTFWETSHTDDGISVPAPVTVTEILNRKQLVVLGIKAHVETYEAVEGKYGPGAQVKLDEMLLLADKAKKPPTFGFKVARSDSSEPVKFTRGHGDHVDTPRVRRTKSK